MGAPITFADRRPPTVLRIACRARGLSIERAAVAARISSGWLRQLERDPSLLSPRIAAQLLPVLGLTPKDLAGSEGRP